MAWRYRLCKSRFHYKLGNRSRSETIYSIREVHGDDEKKDLGWSSQGVRLDGFESPEALKQALSSMLKEALHRPVLWVGNERSERP